MPRREEPAEETSVEARLNRAPSIAVTDELGRAHIDIVIDLHHATCSLAIARTLYIYISNTINLLFV